MPNSIKKLCEAGVGIGSILGVFLSLDWLFNRLSALPEKSYHEPLLVIETARRFVNVTLEYCYLPALIAVSAIVVLYRFGCRSLWHDWTTYPNGKIIRRIVLVTSGILGWTFATYNYNFYFGQGHYVDRLLLVGMLPLIYWRPVFTLPFSLQVLTIIHQFNFPIGGYSVAEQMVLARILIAFSAVFVVSLLDRTPRTTEFVVITCCIIASTYFVSGLAKLRLDWIAVDKVFYLLPATYANGWLGFLDPETISLFTRRLSLFNLPMKIATIVLECGAILLLWNRRSLLFFLCGWIAFHLGIFIVSGICFWKWAVIYAVLVSIIYSNRGGGAFDIFNRRYFFFSLILIGGSSIWFNPVALSWYDTSATYTYRFDAIGESSKRYSLPPAIFSPYDYQFTQSSFRYLSKDRRLGLTWGATNNRDIAESLSESTTVDELLAIETAFGRDSYDAVRAERFDRFIRTFIGNMNASGFDQPWFTKSQPPRWLLTFADDPFRGEERIATVIVREVTSFFDGNHYSEVRDVVARRIEIPMNQPVYAL